MRLVPVSFVEAAWLKTLNRMSRGSIVFESPDGDVRMFKGQHEGPGAHLRIKEWSVIERAAARGDIGLGEDFIAGAWEMDDLETLIFYFLLNLKEVERYSNGRFLNQFAFQIRNNFIRRNSPGGSRRNIMSHYDTGNDFFGLWLDETMTYSAAIFGKPSHTLADAQRNKYRRILSRLEQKHLSILDIGCGWGGFADEAIKTGHHLTGITISPAQQRYAAERVGSAAEIRLEDYRSSKGLYDAVVSIEMVEAVGERYWPVYFRTLADRLRRGGRALIQTILIGDELFSDYRARSDFIRHYVFPGGLLPSLARLKQEAERAGLSVCPRRY